MIKEIEFGNLKGRSGRYSLAPVTVVTGRNFRGKTTVTTAITLACLGHVPALGKTNKGTFRLASGSSMEVRAIFSDGQEVARAWKQSGKSVSLKESGDAPDLVAVLNPSAFIGAKDPATRIAMLAALSPEGRDPATADLRATVGQPSHAEMNIFEWAEVVAEKHETDAKEAAGKIRQWKQTMTGLVDLINASGVPARPVATAQAALEAAVRAESEAAAALRALEEKASASWDAHDELEQMGEIPDADLSTLAADETQRAAEWKEAEGKVLALEAELNQTRKIIQRTEQRAGTRFQTPEDCAQAIAKIEAGGDPTDRHRAARDEMAALENERRRLCLSRDSAARRMESAREQLAALATMTECPTCKACGEGWKDGARKYFIDAAAAAQVEVTDAETATQSTAAKYEAARTAYGLTQNEVSAWNTLRELRQIHSALEEIAAESAKEKATAAALEASRAVLIEKRTAATAATDAHTAAKKKASAAARAKELRVKVTAGPTPEALEASRKALSDAQTTVSRARDAVALEDQANADWKEAQQREKDRVAAEANLAAAEKEQTEADEKAKNIRAKMKSAMASLFGPVLKYAAPLSKAVMGERELTLNAAGEIGFQTATHFIPFEALSGTEQLIATIAIQAGLSATMGGLVMVDEFSRIDDGNKVNLFNALQAMVTAGTLAQVIIVDHDEKFASLAGASGAGIIKLD